MDLLHLIDRESAALLDAAVSAGWEVDVPTCPGWTMRDLVGHLGVVQRFHGGHLTRGVTEPPSGPRPQPPEGDVSAWFREGTETLLHNLRSLGTDAPAWHFGPGPKRTAFWHRRMAHEAAVHRWDAQAAWQVAAPAVGRIDGFDAGFAADGVAEYLEVFIPRRAPTDDGDPEGTVTLVSSEGLTWRAVHGDAAAAHARITGSAEGLYLAVWGRQDLDELAVEGDPDLARWVVNV